jgi:phenol 2-monooxygenase
VFIDDVDPFGRTRGGGYKYYGIDEKEGAAVVVRPDGYIGMVTPLSRVSDLKDYFAGFMNVSKAQALANGLN